MSNESMENVVAVDDAIKISGVLVFAFAMTHTGGLAKADANVSVHEVTDPVPTVMIAALSVPTIAGLVPHVPTVGIVPVEFTWAAILTKLLDALIVEEPAVVVTSNLVEETLLDDVFVIFRLVDVTFVATKDVMVALADLRLVVVAFVTSRFVTVTSPVPAVIGPLFVVWIDSVLPDPTSIVVPASPVIAVPVKVSVAAAIDTPERRIISVRPMESFAIFFRFLSSFIFVVIIFIQNFNY